MFCHYYTAAGQLSALFKEEQEEHCWRPTTQPPGGHSRMWWRRNVRNETCARSLIGICTKDGRSAVMRAGSPWQHMKRSAGAVVELWVRSEAAAAAAAAGPWFLLVHRWGPASSVGPFVDDLNSEFPQNFLMQISTFSFREDHQLLNVNIVIDLCRTGFSSH